MPKNQQITTEFTISTSNCLKWLSTGIHGVSILSCWLNNLPILIQAALSLLCCVSWIYHFRVYKANQAYLRYTQNQNWQISVNNTVYTDMELMPSSVIGRIVSILHLKNAIHSKNLIIFKDAMAINEYRRMIVLIKISG